MTTRALTESQQRVLVAVVQLSNRKGYAPTIAELCAELGMASKSSVHAHLEALQHAGYVTWEPHSPRTLRLVKEPACPRT